MIGYRIIASDKEKHFAFAEKVEVRDKVRLLDCERMEIIDHKGGAWWEPVNSILFNPKIIEEVCRDFLYRIDLTEVGDNASE